MTETWLPSTDGVLTRLTATLRELLSGGHSVLVVAPRGTDPSGDDVLLEGVEVRTVPAAGFRFLYGGQRWGVPLPRVAAFLRTFDPDVVHVVNPACLGIAGIVAARLQRRPLVASYHTDLTQHVPHYGLSWLTPVIWALLRTLHGRAAVNLATSGAAIANLAAHGIPDVQLWPRGIDLDRFGGRPIPRARARDRPVALYVGRLAGEKRLELLDGLADPRSGFDLVIVGDGPMRSELVRRFPPATTTFTGVLHGSALADAYAEADVFVFPSTSETLGLVLMEAIASGLPIVAADSPASRELLSDCPIARLFSADRPEQIVPLARQLAEHPPGEAELAAVRRQAQSWRWSEATARLVECYDEAVAISSTATVGAVRR